MHLKTVKEWLQKWMTLESKKHLPNRECLEDNLHMLVTVEAVAELFGNDFHKGELFPDHFNTTSLKIISVFRGPNVMETIPTLICTID